MNELQKLRNCLFDEIDRVKRGTTTIEESQSIVKLGNSIISSYNTEIKAIETIIEVQDRGANVPKIKFIGDSDDIHKD